MARYLNLDTSRALLGPSWESVDYWTDHFGDEFLSQKGYAFCAQVFADGSVTINRSPARHPHETMVVVFIMKIGAPKSFSGDMSNVAMKFHVPTRLLTTKDTYKYTLYGLRFEMTPDCPVFDASARRVFQMGYLGVTKRPPFTRFNEHYRDAMQGKGHLLHKTWHAISKSGARYLPNFYIAKMARSQDAIYALEEEFVENMTLAPNGLNAIPGGYAGIRFLHKLALLGRGVTDIASRDAAMIALERSKVATHYRSGHVRRLPTGKTTWVSPCWVNAGAAA